MAHPIKHDAAFWEERFGTPACAKNYHYYAYEYLDDLQFMRSAKEVFGDWRHAEALVAAVGEKMKSLGWEGDGEFQIFWLPAFAGAGKHDWFGTYCIHVKQLNDGISWIASPVTLPFHRLFQPDRVSVPAPNPEDPMEALKRNGMVRWLGDCFK